MPPKIVDFIPKKVVPIPKKVDYIPEIVAYPPNKKSPQKAIFLAQSKIIHYLCSIITLNYLLMRYLIPIELWIFSVDDELLWEGYFYYAISERRITEIVNFTLNCENKEGLFENMPRRILESISKKADKMSRKIILDEKIPVINYRLSLPKYLPIGILLLFPEIVWKELNLDGLFDAYDVRTIDELWRIEELQPSIIEGK
mgnify:CR=1 FL=1